MSDILIRGMELPKTCGECRFCRPKPPYPCNCYAGDFLIKPSETDMRDGLCPLHELPEHGDLVDLDERVTKQVYDDYRMEWDMKTKTVRQWLNIDVADMPVVIPSNKEETE